MFSDGANSRDRWSNAKYSLEVFASMLGTDDTLNVFRMSDFSADAAAGPTVTMQGSEPASQRVAKIHNMELQGGGTPYSPVAAAMADLAASTTADRWLVIVSDGEFEGRSAAEVEADLSRFVTENSSADASAQVAFLAVGPDAPTIADNPAAGIFSAQAAETSDLLGTMTSFSNRIFARSLLEQTSPGKIDPDIDMDQLLVFAQGPSVTVGGLSTGGEEIDPTATIEVSWVDNPDVLFIDSTVPAVPNKNLNGVLATYEDVPAGAGVIEVEGAQTIDVFYTPRVAFGIELRDESGERVEADKIVGGEYTVDYGFMDRNCTFIESDLFGDVNYTATVTQNGEVVADDFAPGDVLNLERGDAQLEVVASYLDGNTSEATIDLKVLRPAQPTSFETDGKDFLASELEGYAAPADALELHYAIEKAGTRTDFGAEEWGSFTADSFTVTSPVDNIDFEVSLGAEPGQVYLLPRAPNGEPLDAATGDIPLTVEASHVYDEQLNEASFDTTITIEDDFSPWDRFLHWFLTIGWLWLLLLLLVIWLIGYFVRPSFSRRIKARPTITCKPKSGGKRMQVMGKFEKNRLGALIPYKARTATLTYAQQGFTKMRLKAKRGGGIEIQNWQLLAQRANLRINGEELNKETTKPPLLRPATSITAIGREVVYDMTLNS